MVATAEPSSVSLSRYLTLKCSAMLLIPFLMQDLFGMNKGQQQQADAKRAHLRDSVRRIHNLIVALPSHGDAETAHLAERVKRAKATALSQIATELNRQEIRDLQARTHRGSKLLPVVCRSVDGRQLQCAR